MYAEIQEEVVRLRERVNERLGGHPGLLWAGLGMTAYGGFYFGYLRRLVQAHLIHHKTLERDGAVSFGFLYAPPIETITRNRGGTG